jgi:hypothetical protein
LYPTCPAITSSEAGAAGGVAGAGSKRSEGTLIYTFEKYEKGLQEIIDGGFKQNFVL